MQRESMTKENAPTPVGTNYKPVQTAPKKMEQRWNMAQNQDTGANAVRAERERHEKEVRDREIEKARQVSHTPPPAPARPTFQQEDFAAKQEAERQAAREQEENERRYQQQQEEENYRRQQQQEEYHRQQEDEERRRQEHEAEERRRQEEADRLRQQEEADRKRQQEEADRKRQQEEADRKRQQEEEEEEERERREEEAERHRQHDIATAEHKRRQQEEDQKQAALQSQLNATADRAVHAAAGAAAGAAIASTAKPHHQGVSATVLFAYEASENNEMSLNEGEIVHQIDQVDEGWWFGVSEDGKKQGLFPANYVQILEEEEEEEAPVPQAPPAPAVPQAPPAPQQQEQNDGNVAVALYDYAAEEDNEISFNEGDHITQIEFVSDDWWQGLAANGKNVGLFPGKHLFYFSCIKKF